MENSIRILINTLLIIFSRAGSMLIELGPYVIIGTAIGEVIKHTSWTRIAYKALSRSPAISILGAVVVGVVSPLCTYGTAPVVLQLFKAGIGVARLH
jgi:uncharacterized membrane protein YraQ (UPF0718 family)